MSRIVVCGGGVCGLVAAMALAGDGHDVTVLERDPAPPPDPIDAWDDWERRGVNQFRLAHFLMPAFRTLMAAEIPQVVAALERAGAHSFNLLGAGAAALDPDGRFDVVTGRRPLVEAAIAGCAEETPGVTVRRGVAVAAFLTGSPVRTGTPHVTGVVTEDGQHIAADLVLDATGRRSPLTRWLVAAGARPPYEEEEDSGFVYYGRHVGSPDGRPLFGGPSLSHHGSISLLALPADRGTAGVGVVGASRDAALRRLTDDGAWRRVVAALPEGRKIVEADQISPLVSMAKIEDRFRRMVVDGEPVATGVLPVADSWACTNPTLGRGIALGSRHAVAMRDVIRDAGLDDPYKLAVAADEITQRDFTPWYRSTIWHDRHRLADSAAAAGLGPPVDEPAWTRFKKLWSRGAADMALLGRFLAVISLQELPEEVLAEPAVAERLDALDEPEPTGPDREQLLALIAG